MYMVTSLSTKLFFIESDQIFRVQLFVKLFICFVTVYLKRIFFNKRVEGWSTFFPIVINLFHKFDPPVI